MMPPTPQLELALKIIQLIEPGEKVLGPPNIVYSTNPKIADAMDGYKYFVKGPDAEVVAAEACAHLLAGVVDLSVPVFGIAEVDGQVYFASREIEIRNASSFIERQKVQNRDILHHTIAFDVWIANTDRNLGNFVAESISGSSQVRALPIDFEKARTICERTPIVSVPMIDPRRLWPREALGEMLTGPGVPVDFCRRIER